MVAFWILFCVFWNCVGWLLSAFHLLNQTGYGIAMGVLALLVFWGWVNLGRPPLGRSLRAAGRKLRWRFRRGLPLMYLGLFCLAFLGGALYEPANYDGLAYRTPRVLHWLAEGQWHWIHSDFSRVNTRALGYEWLTAPLYALTGGDRLQFLINIVSFGLLPGVTFSLFTRLGLRRRLAWAWMWLLPTGYCFLLQAGSIANDLFGVIFALAAVDFALRAKSTNSVVALRLSILAAALLAGSKASNIPLGLPWFLAVLPCWRLLLKQRVVTLIVLGIAVLCSFAPIACMNIKQCGDWTGQKLENACGGGMPLIRLGVNSILLAHGNFAPPVFPLAGVHNAWMANNLPARWHEVVGPNFEGGAAQLRLGELQVEEQAGVGLGVSLILVAGLVAGLKCSWQQRRQYVSLRFLNWWKGAILLSPFVGLLLFMVTSGLSGIPRLVAPYYFMCAPALLCLGQQTAVVRRRWWHWLGRLNFIMAGALLVLCPARPLWPALTCLRWMGGAESPRRVVQRMWTVYSVYRHRPDAFAPIKAHLPPAANPLGMVTRDDPETSLWRPFGSRRIAHVTKADTAVTVRTRGLRYVLVSTDGFADHFQQSFEEWLAMMDGQILKTVPLKLRAGRESFDWHLIELRPQGNADQKARVAPLISPSLATGYVQPD